MKRQEGGLENQRKHIRSEQLLSTFSLATVDLGNRKRQLCYGQLFSPFTLLYAPISFKKRRNFGPK